MEKSAWRRVWEFGLAVVRRFYEERGTQTAGSLTYTTLLSLVPLFTVALAVTTAFPVFDEDRRAAALHPGERAARHAGRSTPSSTRSTLHRSNAGRLTAIGIAASARHRGDADAHGRQRAEPHLPRAAAPLARPAAVLMYWAVITLGPLLIGGSLSVTYVRAVRHSAGRCSSSYLRDALLGMLPFVLTCGALALLYGVVPARRVEWRHALHRRRARRRSRFEIAKRGFAIYLGRVPTYTLIYGAFATIPIFLVWLYLSWLVVLTGAIVTAMLPAFRTQAGAPPGAGRELADALGVLSRWRARTSTAASVPLNAPGARAAHHCRDRVEAILERAAALGWAARTEQGRLGAGARRGADPACPTSTARSSSTPTRSACRDRSWFIVARASADEEESA